MNKQHRRAGSRILAALTGLALAATAAGTAVADESSSPQPLAKAVTAAPAPVGIAPAQKFGSNLAGASGPISVYVQFQGQGAFDATQPQSVKDNPASKTVDASAAVQQIRAGIESTAASVTAESAGTHLYTTTNTLPGAGITADAAQIRELAKRPDVLKITQIVPKTVTNAGTDIDTGVVGMWTASQATGKRADGSRVKIAVIDTGLDYTHTDFGGPGTPEAYAQAKALTTFPTEASGLYDPLKFVGGWDLVGDTYNADPTSASYQPVPNPDANPLDCGTAGHGSHVAGTAAGYGVNADGTTFDGDYGTLDANAVNALRIGPGSAPEAEIYALRVFGCEGSTDVVAKALDMALDPNGDGSFDDHMDIVNMSLGSNGSPTDDPESDLIDKLAENGVLTVSSSGNSGDTFDIGGAPGNARSALTVANSVGSQAALDKIDVLAQDGSVASTAAGQYSDSFNYSGAGVTPATLTGTVLYAPGPNLTGCTAFSSEEAAVLAGKWVMLSWDDNDATRPCGSAARFNNAQAAGATGVVFDSQRTVFEAGIAGNATIPGVQFNKAASDALTPAAKAGTLKIALAPGYKGLAAVPTGALDTLNAGSSRGVHGSNGIVKPDVAAPGTSIASAGVASGSGAAVKSGTSMSAPHVAGIAAALLSTIDLSPAQLKTTIMNTANVDVKVGATIYGPNRVGSGRVNASDALTSHVMAYATDDPALTSVNFGVVEVEGQPVTVAKSITLENRGAAASYSVAYNAATAMPGVAYSVSPSSVAVPANGTAEVTITMTIADPAALAKALDPTMSPLMLGLPRQFLADASGRVEFTAAGAPALRVPVYAAPKPSAAMSAGAIAFGKKELATTAQLTGRGVSQGSGAENYTSLVAPFVLGAESGELAATQAAPLTNKSMDLAFVGAATTVPSVAKSGGTPADLAARGMVNFGIATHGNWASLLTASALGVEIDTTGDGVADYSVMTGHVTDFDGVIVSTTNLATGTLVDQQPANGVWGNVDTNSLDTNVISLPVSAAALGLDLTKPAPITYKVVTRTQYAYNNANADANVVDETDPIAFDIVAPALSFSGSDSGLFEDTPGTAIGVDRDTKTTGAKALFLHLHNASGQKAQVVDATVEHDNGNGNGNGPKGTSSAASVQAGSPLTVSGEGFPAGMAATVTLHSDPVQLAAVTTSAEGAFAVDTIVPANTPAGEHTIVLLAADGSTFSIPLTVTAADAAGGGDAGVSAQGSLAATGASALTPLLIAGASVLVVAGVLLLVLRRRRADGS
ncbi:S8 family serine peptidase [Arthrobacter sp. 35W]|uniref:S8 family serine peptidase n=1 Tax=Arthrobacter sp. 35W TaxID=1132441 RepID=UPI0003F60ED2|nr:S8 family serine peptidase [Arthrobacter sp. 35W]